MSNSDDIRDAVADDMISGEAERQVSDRRIRYFSPKERLEAAREIAAKEHSPFVKIGFKDRSV